MLSCLLHARGLLYVTLPVGPDLVVFNAMRRYGALRLPMVLAGWHVVDILGGYDKNLLSAPAPWQMRKEPVFVLQKTSA